MSESIPLSILMLAPLRYVASMAFVMESIVAFAELGHQVDVVVSGNCDPPFACSNPNVRIRAYKDTWTQRGIHYLKFFETAWRCAATRPYDAVIALSQMGLIAANLLKDVTIKNSAS